MKAILCIFTSLFLYISATGQRFVAPPPLRTPGTLSPVPLIVTDRQPDIYLPGESTYKPFIKTHIVEVESYATSDANLLLEMLKEKAAASGVDGVMLSNLGTKSITTLGNVASLAGIGIKYIDQLDYLDTILRQRVITRYDNDENQIATLLLDYDWYGNLLTNMASMDVFFYADSMAFIDLHVIVNRHATYLNYQTFDFTKSGVIKTTPGWIRKIRIDFDPTMELHSMASTSSPFSTETDKVKVNIRPVYNGNLLTGAIINSTQKGEKPLYYLYYKYDAKGRITDERWEKIVAGKRTLWLAIENRFFSSQELSEQSLLR